MHMRQRLTDIDQLSSVFGTSSVARNGFALSRVTVQPHGDSYVSRRFCSIFLTLATRVCCPCVLTISTLVLFCLATPSQAQLVQEHSTVDNSGQVVSGGTLSGVTAGGQPGGIMTSSGGDLTLYAGFLGCVTLQPTLDTDGDGVVDEMDADNDNDNLSDIAELHGSSFSPTTVTDLNSTDTDNDGASDGDESLSMTNPQDATAYLHLTHTDFNPFVSNQVSIEWFARGGTTYNVYYRKNSDLLPGTLLDTVLVTGGAAPWFETTATVHTGISSWQDMTYHIEKVP